MWLYDEKEFNETPEEYQGFVYQITELSTGKKYIGKKNFWSPKTLPKNSKRPRKIKTRVESNWREYYGSNKELQENAKENQKDYKWIATFPVDTPFFKREILKDFIQNINFNEPEIFKHINIYLTKRNLNKNFVSFLP